MKHNTFRWTTVPPALTLAAALVLQPLLSVTPSFAATPDAATQGWEITAAGSQDHGRWQLFDLEVEHASTIEIVGNWSGDADVNLFLRKDGAQVASANSTTAMPETLRYEATPGRYSLAVFVKSGTATNYDVTVIATPTPIISTIQSTGSQTKGRWQLFDIDVAKPSTLDLSTSWSGDADVNLFLRKDGAPVAFANSTTAKPETLRYEAAPGRYSLAVYVRTGSATYTVDTATTPTVASPVTVLRGLELPTPEPEAPVHTPEYAGQPAEGSLAWGASIHGGGDPVARHEADAGIALGVRRTFHQWSGRTGSLLRTAEGDLAAGRLPWVSVKTPSWAAMAAGKHDAETDQMLKGLDRLEGPVWLTIHHEPEGGGGNTSGEAADDPAGPAGHLAMNRRVRTRMDALGVDNVALVPVFMAWTFDPKSGRNIEQWWDDGVYDLLGIDIYQRNEGPQIHDMRSWKTLRTWADQKGVDVAVGEWGMRGTDAASGARVKAWYDHAIGSATDGRGARVVGQSAFDSGLNSPSGSWELRGEQLTTFRHLLHDARTARDLS